MRALKWIGFGLVGYVAIVTAFESLIGTFQPSDGTTLVISTRDAEGETHDRVVSRLESGGKLYVAANHWPRAWYRRALANPQVEVTIEGNRGPYEAVPVDEAERARVEADHPLPLVFRFLTGFPPRPFLRLDPQTPSG